MSTKFWLQVQAPAGNWVDSLGSNDVVTCITHGDKKAMIERVFDDLKTAADNATGGDFAVVEYDVIPGCKERLGINAKQYGGYITQLQAAGRIFVDKTTVNGNERITQITFP